ncbi:MAG: hypothetical protein AAGK78_11435, partial [Planctomycetota bacterium]
RGLRSEQIERSRTSQRVQARGRSVAVQSEGRVSNSLATKNYVAATTLAYAIFSYRSSASGEKLSL